MRTAALTTGGTILLIAALATAAPPDPPPRGLQFDCSRGGTTSCAVDDSGCVPDNLDHANCSASIGGHFANAAAPVIVCHSKKAFRAFRSESFDEEACENAVEMKLAGFLSIKAASPRCDAEQVPSPFVMAQYVDSLDQLNGAIYCDSASGMMIDPSGDDPGWIPTEATLKCSSAVAKNLAKLVKGAFKCHKQMAHAFLRANDFDEESCEEGTVLSKFDTSAQGLASICPPCLDPTHQDMLARSVLSQRDSETVNIYPCCTTATCGTQTCVAACGVGNVVVRKQGPCSVTAATGSCTGTAGETCCVCKCP